MDIADAETALDLFVGIGGASDECFSGGEGFVGEAFGDLEFDEVFLEVFVVGVGGDEVLPDLDGVGDATGSGEETAFELLELGEGGGGRVGGGGLVEGG